MDALRNRLGNLLGNLWQRSHPARRRTQLLLGVVAAFTIVSTILSACAGPSSTAGTPTTPTTQVSSPSPVPTATPTQAPAQPLPLPPTATSTTAPATPTPLSPTATPKPATPTPAPTRPTTIATTPPKTGVNGNPWGYDFNRGSLIYNPPAGFCSYFDCISSFSDGKGYVVQCQNGDYSKSGGRKGVCSKQGGFKQNLYSH